MKNTLIALFVAFGFGCGNGGNNANNVNNANNRSDVGDVSNNVNNVNNRVDMSTDTGTDATQDMGAVATLTEYCEALSVAEMQNLWNCESWGGERDVAYDPASPDAPFRRQFGCHLFQGHIDAGTVTYDGAQAKRCIDALAEIADDCVGIGITAVDKVEECNTVIVGNSPPGGACYNEVECSDEATRCRTAGSCPGSCALYAGAGDPCSEGCGPDTYCDFGVTDLCVAKSPGGGPCVDFTQCLEGQCVNGTCRAWADYGEACDDNTPCRVSEVTANGELLHQCIDGLCEYKAGEGESCIENANCEFGFWCFRLDPSQLGVCAPIPGLGMACGFGDVCGEGLYCDNGLCQPGAGENESCDTMPCADYRHRCMDDDRCHPPGDVGEPCSPYIGTSCTEGLVCDAVTALCGPPAALGEPCNPYGTNISWGVERVFTAPCDAGLRCLCNTLGCRQGTVTEPHFCEPIIASGRVECRMNSECGNTQICSSSPTEGHPFCTSSAACRREP